MIQPDSRLRLAIALCALLLLGALASPLAAADKKPAANPTPDTLVLTDGNTLRGTFVKEVNGTVTFHTPALGDFTVAWAKVKELHTTEPFAVLSTSVKSRGKHAAAQVPTGTLDATSTSVTVHPAGQAAAEPIPTKDAQYIVERSTLDKQLYHSPGFFAGWNGAATAGATLVSATQNQYTFAGAIGLVRIVPTVTWLTTRNRTTTDFSGSFGKITQPAYTSGGVYTPAVITKTAILHFDAERDRYFSPRFFALAQTAMDHNYSQDLSLQQIYGAGIGWTVLKAPTQEADLKGTLQYEKQSFISGAPSANQNLIGSTLSADYMLKRKLFTLTQTLAFIPAFNDSRAYSANETDTVAFPTWKNLGFSVGTLDSYLNDPPISAPPTKRNSFQFTMGLTYAIKSKY